MLSHQRPARRRHSALTPAADIHTVLVHAREDLEIAAQTRTALAAGHV